MVRHDSKVRVLGGKPVVVVVIKVLVLVHLRYLVHISLHSLR